MTQKLVLNPQAFAVDLQARAVDLQAGLSLYQPDVGIRARQCALNPCWTWALQGSKGGARGQGEGKQQCCQWGTGCEPHARTVHFHGSPKKSRPPQGRRFMLGNGATDEPEAGYVISNSGGASFDLANNLFANNRFGVWPQHELAVQPRAK